jgi:hypothetical protein
MVISFPIPLHCQAWGAGGKTTKVFFTLQSKMDFKVRYQEQGFAVESR